MSEFRKMLVLQTAFIGDVILSTYFIRALHELFPHAEVDILLIPEASCRTFSLLKEIQKQKILHSYKRLFL